MQFGMPFRFESPQNTDTSSSEIVCNPTSDRNTQLNALEQQIEKLYTTEGTISESTQSVEFQTQWKG